MCINHNPQLYSIHPKIQTRLRGSVCVLGQISRRGHREPKGYTGSHASVVNVSSISIVVSWNIRLKDSVQAVTIQLRWRLIYCRVGTRRSTRDRDWHVDTGVYNIWTHCIYRSLRGAPTLPSANALAAAASCLSRLRTRGQLKPTWRLLTRLHRLSLETLMGRDTVVICGTNSTCPLNNSQLQCTVDELPAGELQTTRDAYSEITVVIESDNISTSLTFRCKFSVNEELDGRIVSPLGGAENLGQNALLNF